MAVLGCAILAAACVAAASVVKDESRITWLLFVVAGVLLAIPGLVAASGWGQQRRAEAVRRDEIVRSRAADRRTHFETAARGVARAYWHGSLFTGRARALTALAAWLGDASAGSLRVVVGQPGSGKSAVLGRLVELSDPVTRKGAADDASADCLPRAKSVHLELTARGRTLADLVERIASGARITAGSVDELMLGLRDRKIPLVVVLDGLNESVEPELAARELVSRLAGGELGTGLRMVVGTRPTLLRAIGVSAGEVIDLDGPEYFEAADLVEYTRTCLREFSTPDNAVGLAEFDEIAAGIAERAGKAFLVAQLTARAVGRAGGEARWQERFPDSVGAAMDTYLDRIPHAGTTAWQELVRQYAPLVWQIARNRCLPAEHASRAVRATWRRLLAEFLPKRPPVAFTDWLFTTARQEATRVAAAAHPACDPGQPPHGPEEMPGMTEQDLLLWRALQQLPRRCSLLLRVLAGEETRSYHDIAAALGMPIGSLGPTQGRCLNRLRQLMQVIRTGDLDIPATDDGLIQALRECPHLVDTVPPGVVEHAMDAWEDHQTPPLPGATVVDRSPEVTL